MRRKVRRLMSASEMHRMIPARSKLSIIASISGWSWLKQDDCKGRRNRLALGTLLARATVAVLQAHPASLHSILARDLAQQAAIVSQMAFQMLPMWTELFLNFLIANLATVIRAQEQNRI